MDTKKFYNESEQVFGYFGGKCHFRRWTGPLIKLVLTNVTEPASPDEILEDCRNDSRYEGYTQQVAADLGYDKFELTYNTVNLILGGLASIGGVDSRIHFDNQGEAQVYYDRATVSPDMVEELDHLDVSLGTPQTPSDEDSQKVNETFDLNPGDILDEQYEVKENLGGRISNQVWLAADIETGEDVVLKSFGNIHDYPKSERKVLEKIKNEGGHNNIVNLRDTIEIERTSSNGRAKTAQVLVKDYIEGPTLQKYVSKSDNGIGAELVYNIGIQLANALGKTHNRDFVLREFSPSDIILTDQNKPVLTDLGLAFPLFKGGEAAVVKSEFAAPEVQQPGSRIDAGADVYTLGKILFYSLTGGLVPDDHSLDPNEYSIDISDGLGFVITEATKEDRDDRIPTGTVMAKKLKLYKNEDNLDI